MLHLFVAALMTWTNVSCRSGTTWSSQCFNHSRNTGAWTGACWEAARRGDYIRTYLNTPPLLATWAHLLLVTMTRLMEGQVASLDSATWAELMASSPVHRETCTAQMDRMEWNASLMKLLDSDCRSGVCVCGWQETSACEKSEIHAEVAATAQPGME